MMKNFDAKMTEAANLVATGVDAIPVGIQYASVARPFSPGEDMRWSTN